jgi:hypothetical protein
VPSHDAATCGSIVDASRGAGRLFAIVLVRRFADMRASLAGVGCASEHPTLAAGVGEIWVQNEKVKVAQQVERNEKQTEKQKHVLQKKL